ncbi:MULTISPECIES: molybdate ABC transporter permease subunit [Achromobacter]|uniref:Molybdenum transport system permease n=2 Tax=Achromobacter piechaudii TaxID=72556 RepID=A0A6S7DXW3_9BURK|nr:molybdate ABC transporter permease subunit [Achromobacter piechaudii]EFF74310.1 molybdate ABC transporter, permease protein [Achromobacter piechaudii ATCC 43553]KNY08846.1 molybdate ABC transporter permease [Achromobacter piechaudii]MPS76840.1 molybdate ABC transporter permease subunit [Achromobacter sp.]CAB3700894.1 Molybdenum transport system permease protein ModB [Achromobacter piechaudii]CAB3851544.1 Molybdenum transport system permease protein ModB [Achromobacter piechaudii]
MTDPVWIPLLLSLKVAGWATLLATLAGTAAAYGLSRWRWPGRDLLDALLTLPLVLPPTVLGYYLLVLLGRRGVIGEVLAKWNIELVFTWQGAVIAASIVAFPLVFKSARAAFENVDIQLENAARVLGVGEVGIFFRVTLPLAARSILAGVLLAFARALGEFGATLMIAGNLPGRTQTLSVAIYEAVQAGDDRTANLLVLVTSITCVVVLLAAGKLVPKGASLRDGGGR